MQAFLSNLIDKIKLIYTVQKGIHLRTDALLHPRSTVPTPNICLHSYVRYPPLHPKKQKDLKFPIDRYQIYVIYYNRRTKGGV